GGGRLVHYQDSRRVGERLDDRHDLAMSNRELAHAPLDVDIKLDRLEALPRLAAHACDVEQSAGPQQLVPEEEVRGDIEARNQIQFLKDGGDAGNLRIAR